MAEEVVSIRDALDRALIVVRDFARYAGVEDKIDGYAQDLRIYYAEDIVRKRYDEFNSAIDILWETKVAEDNIAFDIDNQKQEYLVELFNRNFALEDTDDLFDTVCNVLDTNSLHSYILDHNGRNSK